MLTQPYLIAIALIDQNDQRAMPIGGKSMKESLKDNEPGRLGEDLAKELLVRIFERSANGPLMRAGEKESLLLVEINIEEMQLKLPKLKSQWITNGKNKLFLNELKAISNSIWSLNFSKERRLFFTRYN